MQVHTFCFSVYSRVVPCWFRPPQRFLCDDDQDDAAIRTQRLSNCRLRWWRGSEDEDWMDGSMLELKAQQKVQISSKKRPNRKIKYSSYAWSHKSFFFFFCLQVVNLTQRERDGDTKSHMKSSVCVCVEEDPPPPLLTCKPSPRGSGFFWTRLKQHLFPIVYIFLEKPPLRKAEPTLPSEVLQAGVS